MYPSPVLICYESVFNRVYVILVNDAIECFSLFQFFHNITRSIIVTSIYDRSHFYFF